MTVAANKRHLIVCSKKEPIEAPAIKVKAAIVSISRQGDVLILLSLNLTVIITMITFCDRKPSTFIEIRWPPVLKLKL